MIDKTVVGNDKRTSCNCFFMNTKEKGDEQDAEIGKFNIGKNVCV